MTKRTWQISDIDGTNKRSVTLDQYLAEVRASKIDAEKIAAKNYGVRFVRPTPAARTDESESYRKAMKDSGRGHLIR